MRPEPKTFHKRLEAVWICQYGRVAHVSEECGAVKIAKHEPTKYRICSYCCNNMEFSYKSCAEYLDPACEFRIYRSHSEERDLYDHVINNPTGRCGGNLVWARNEARRRHMRNPRSVHRLDRGDSETVWVKEDLHAGASSSSGATTT